MSQPKKKEVAESDWTGGLSILWVVGFLAMCLWSVWTANMVLLEKVVALLGTPTMLVLKFYFDKKENSGQ